MNQTHPTASSLRFHDLMWYRISEVLLVSSPYDAFILEQDGQLTEQVFREYSKLSLPAPPRFTHAASGEQAMELLEMRRFDLVMTMTSLADMDVNAFGRRVKALRPGRPVVVLALDRRELHDLRCDIDKKAIDGVFLWSGDSKILLAIIKYIEDKDNLDLDILHGNLRVIIVVEDSPYYYSLFLGQLYKELTLQALSLYAEGSNEIMRQMYMKSRPKILLATTFEEGEELLKRYNKNLLAIISDLRIPRRGRLDPQAGLAFVRRARRLDPDLPVLLQSAEPFDEYEAERLQAAFLDKNSPNLLAGIRTFLSEAIGFGDFLFREPDDRVIGRAKNLRELEEKLATLSESSLIFHAKHNHFSIWLNARSEFDLADRIRPRQVTEFKNADAARRFLIRSLRENRRRVHRGVVADFTRERFDRDPFVRLGHGALGGKGRGLAFLNSLLARCEPEEFDGLHIGLPKTVVLTTEHFDEFLERNDLHDFAVACEDDDEIERRFLQASLPDPLVDDLGFILDQMRVPLAVRSSSMLEDSMHQRMAGIYNTLMLPNNAPETTRRLQEVCAAIKLVYASTFSHNARAYLKGTGKRTDEEKMAVILQELVGSVHGPRFYPTFSGVAHSYNFYPIGPQSADEGVAYLALGFGRLIVTGGQALRFSPKHPEVLPQFSKPKNLLDRSQRGFFALDLTSECCDPHADLRSTLGFYLLEIAELDGTLGAIGSVYSHDDRQIRDDLTLQGPRLVTFNNILKHRAIPLPKAIERLLDIGSEGLGCAVEVELAGEMGDWGKPVRRGRKRTPPRLYVLQIRPFASVQQMTTGPLLRFATDDLICSSTLALGNGLNRDFHDLIYVDYAHWDAAQTREIAIEVGRLNEELENEDRPYVLIGPGRWGTADRWLGIPVEWAQISGARLIVEASPSGFDVEPSQGTHFFQNLTSLEIGYLTLPPGAESQRPAEGVDFLDRTWLDAQKAHRETRHLRWLRFEEPLTVSLQGRRGHGMIAKPGATVDDGDEEEEL